MIPAISSQSAMLFPSIDSIRSPLIRPAISAGDPFSTDPVVVFNMNMPETRKITNNIIIARIRLKKGPAPTINIFFRTCLCVNEIGISAGSIPASG
jgi:hypothetical protein